MKPLFTKLRSIIKKHQNQKNYKQTLIDIASLNKAMLLPQHIELFLNLKLDDFDRSFFETYFSKYVYLFDKLNILALITYIDFIESMKVTLKKEIFKKTIYPCFLFLVSIFTLFIFRNYLMGMLQEYTSVFINILVEVIYKISIFLIVLVISALLLMLIIINRKDYYLLTYRTFFNLKIFRLTEIYNLKIITQLLLIAYEDGLSTLDTFELMNSFKGETIVANIAYFVTSDLEEGLGIDESLDNMRVSHQFKKLLSFAMQSDDYKGFIQAYLKQLDFEFKKEINILSKKLYALSYVYIFVVILLFYKILSLPLSLIQNI